MSDKALLEAVEKYYKTEVLAGKGGFFVKGKGFISTSKARKITGLAGKKRNTRMVQGAWGDYATVAMLNRPRKAKSAPKLR